MNAGTVLPQKNCSKQDKLTQVWHVLYLILCSYGSLQKPVLSLKVVTSTFCKFSQHRRLIGICKVNCCSLYIKKQTHTSRRQANSFVETHLFISTDKKWLQHCFNMQVAARPLSSLLPGQHMSHFIYLHITEVTRPSQMRHFSSPAAPTLEHNSVLKWQSF